jgi:hypothetical protein
MRRWITISIVVFSIILASTVQAGGLLQKLYFVGLWEGIDDFDGSVAQRSITLDSDGKFYIIGQEPYTFGCGGERGKITATGVLKDGVIYSDDFSLTCYNGSNGFKNGIVEYVPDKLNGTLIESFPDSSIDFPPSVLHKISNR